MGCRIRMLPAVLATLLAGTTLGGDSAGRPEKTVLLELFTSQG